MDRRTHKSVRKLETKNHGDTVSGTQNFELSEYIKHGREHKRSRGNDLARTDRRKIETGWICQTFLFRYRKQIRHQWIY